MICSLIGLFAFAATKTVSGQATASTSASTPTTKAARSAGLVSDLKGISIGMTGDQVQKKLGKADVSDASGMLFELDDHQTLQVRLDNEKTVTMIAVVYNEKSSGVPEFTEILGSDVQVTPQENGNIYKMVRSPSAGYWVAYSRIKVGDGEMTTITMQKMN